MTSDKIFFLTIVAAFTLLAAVWDFRTKKLPNWLTVSGFVAGLAYHIVAGAFEGGWSGVGSHLLFSLGGFGTGFGILLVLWLIGGGGAGDVKMMGALGAWLGPQTTVFVFVLSTVMIVFFTMGLLAYRTLAEGLARTKQKYLKRVPERASPEAQLAAKSRRRLMPYGVPVALATWAVLLVQVFQKGQ